MMTSETPIVDGNGPLQGKKVLVMGLGRFGGGVGVSRWLVEQGAMVTVNDAAPADQLQESVEKLAGLPITFRLGGHDVADFMDAKLIVINPAVDKKNSLPLQMAGTKGIPFTTEMNLFLERCPAFTIGITGSVGKSTTTTLIYEALKAAVARDSSPDAPRIFLGGNIGKSLLGELGTIRKTDIVVLEISSFMLEETPAIGWSPNVAVVTNLYPNHLDRHGTMAEYAATKQAILKFQKPGDTLIVNGDHMLVQRWTHFAKEGVDAVKYSARGPKKVELVIPGEHNVSNAAAALAVLEAVGKKFPGIDRAAAVKAIEAFPGLSHRLQLVHSETLEGGRVLRFYNDSKATSPDASITAIDAFRPGTAIFFAGGYDKHIDLSAYEEALRAKAAGVIGLGATGAAIVGNVEKEFAGKATYAETLEAGMPLAREWAKEMPTVEAIVMSPASASWGQFKNYEERGERFIALARKG